MKVFGNLALGSSSARKYLSTCVSCFQKLSVSCCQKNVSALRSSTFCVASHSSARAYLELGVAVVDEDVGGLELGDVAVTLELLPHLGANGGNGDVERVHGLDLGGLSSRLASVWLCLSRTCSSFPIPDIPQLFLFARLRSRAFVPHAASPGRSGLHVAKHPPSWRLWFLVSSMASLEGSPYTHT
jgi:hypothetical protein